MRRFFLPDHLPTDERIVLTGPEARHIALVLRLQPGQSVELFNGRGTVSTAILDTVARDRVTAAITATREETAVTGSPLTLVQCLLKGKKMDLLVQKATELGVQALVTVVSRRCENRGDRDRQQERWQRIMLEACKQSHRATPMAILPVLPLDRFDFAPYAHRLVAWEEERRASLPTDLAHRPGPICLFLGPEGGLDNDDLQVLHRWHCTTFSLGPLILRGDTAALAATAIGQYLTGSLCPPPAETLP